VRACAVEMHFNIQKNAGAQSEHPDQAPAFTPTVSTPQCGHTVWGISRTWGSNQFLGLNPQYEIVDW
jgi:hypothetical protein